MLTEPSSQFLVFISMLFEIICALVVIWLSYVLDKYFSKTRVSIIFFNANGDRRCNADKTCGKAFPHLHWSQRIADIRAVSFPKDNYSISAIFELPDDMLKALIQLAEKDGLQYHVVAYNKSICSLNSVGFVCVISKLFKSPPKMY